MCVYGVYGVCVCDSRAASATDRSHRLFTCTVLNPGVVFISMAMQQCGGSTGQLEGMEMSAEKVLLESHWLPQLVGLLSRYMSKGEPG